MGKTKRIIDFVHKTITLDWSEIDDTQMYWIGRSQGYPLQIEDEDNSGVMIDNPIPIFIWVQAKKAQEVADAARAQYLAETPDPRIPAADAIADFTPE